MLSVKWVWEVFFFPAALSKVLGEDKASVEVLFQRKSLRLGGTLYSLFDLHFTVFVATIMFHSGNLVVFYVVIRLYYVVYFLL